MLENSVSEHIVSFCARAANIGDCLEAKPTYRNLHCIWNPRAEGIHFGPDSDWTRYYDGGIPKVKFVRTIKNTTPKSCAYYCLGFGGCKSFTYVKKRTDYRYMNCYLYNISGRKNSHGVQISAQINLYNLIDHYELFDELPSQTIGKCTHKIEYRKKFDIVQMCKKSDKLQCSSNQHYCQINFDEEPSKVPGECTHHQNFRSDKQIVDDCKNLLPSKCSSNRNCVLNFDESPSSIPGACTH